MGFFHLHLHLLIWLTLLIFHVDHEIAIDLPLRWNFLEKKEKKRKD